MKFRFNKIIWQIVRGELFMIKVSRQSSHYDKFRNYQIFIDNIHSCDISNGETKEIDISNGQHIIYLKIDWCRSNKLTFFKDNNIIEFECGNSIRGLKRLVLLVYIFFLKNKYLFIKFKDKHKDGI